MGKIAFIFSGYDKDIIESEMMINGCETLKKNLLCMMNDLKSNMKGFSYNIDAKLVDKITTIDECMFVLNMVISNMLLLKGIVPSYISGFSLGDLHALCFSGAILFEDLMKILDYRYKLFMKDKALLNLTMVSAEDIDHSVVEILSSKYEDAYPISYNTKNKTIVLIKERFLNDFCKSVKYSGGKTKILNKNIDYSMPFYNSKSMEPIMDLSRDELNRPNIPTYVNLIPVKEKTKSQDVIQDILTAPIVLVSTIDRLSSAGVDTFIEIGGKGLLCNDIKAVATNASVYSANDLESVDHIVREIFAHV